MDFFVFGQAAPLKTRNIYIINFFQQWLKNSINSSFLMILLILVFSIAMQGWVPAVPVVQGKHGLLRVNSLADTVDIAPGDGLCADSTGMCTLRAAIMEANSSHGEMDIRLSSGIYTLEIPGANENGAVSGDLDINQSMIIQGIGRESPVIQAGTSPSNSIDRVFHILGSDSKQSIKIKIQNITIQNGERSYRCTISK